MGPWSLRKLWTIQFQRPCARYGRRQGIHRPGANGLCNGGNHFCGNFCTRLHCARHLACICSFRLHKNPVNSVPLMDPLDGLENQGFQNYHIASINRKTRSKPSDSDLSLRAILPHLDQRFFTWSLHAGCKPWLTHESPGCVKLVVSVVERAFSSRLRVHHFHQLMKEPQMLTAGAFMSHKGGEEPWWFPPNSPHFLPGQTPDPCGQLIW